jgi:hypothetical protein
MVGGWRRRKGSRMMRKTSLILLGEVARHAPYLSGALIIAVGLYTGYLGWTQFLQHHL